MFWRSQGINSTRLAVRGSAITDAAEFGAGAGVTWSGFPELATIRLHLICMDGPIAVRIELSAMIRTVSSTG
jgi:hypothetical protein